MLPTHTGVGLRREDVPIEGENLVEKGARSGGGEVSKVSTKSCVVDPERSPGRWRITNFVGLQRSLKLTERCKSLFKCL